MLLQVHQRRSEETVPQQCLCVTFRTLIRPADHLEVIDLLYFPPSGSANIHYFTWHTGHIQPRMRQDDHHTKLCGLGLLVSAGTGCPSRELELPESCVLIVWGELGVAPQIIFQLVACDSVVFSGRWSSCCCTASIQIADDALHLIINQADC